MFLKMLKSRTLIGATIMLLSVVLKQYGIDIGDHKEDLVDLVFQFAAFCGFALTVYGRVKADGPIKRVIKNKD